MNDADALELVKQAIWTVIAASGPSVGAAMVVGIAVSLFQALTQIQEATLTFVPKIMAVFFATLVFAHYMGAVVFGLATFTFSRIETGF